MFKRWLQQYSGVYWVNGKVIPASLLDLHITDDT